MPRARFLAPWQDAERMAAVLASCRELDAEELAGLVGKPAIYHCVSRVVDRRFVFGDREKEKFVALMRCYEEFSQVQVLAFCVMSNHFHILVEVPCPPPERGRDWSDERLLEHLACLYGPKQLGEIRWQLELLREQKAGEAAEAYRDKFFARMWDLSEFMKGLKQSFSRWFNMVHNRHGTLWEERFKSVLAEDGHATRMIAAYIDLNPMRAGMVDDPKDYRWSSYGQAVAGKGRAREGIERVMRGGPEGKNADGELNKGSTSTAGVISSWREVVRGYRQVLDAPLFRAGDKSQRGKNTADETQSEAAPPVGTVRQFTEGFAVGLPPFLEWIFSFARDWFGPRRRNGARKMRGFQTELRAMRDLQARQRVKNDLPGGAPTG